MKNQGDLFVDPEESSEDSSDLPLPDARAVNRLLRAQHRAQQHSQNLATAGAGTLTALLREACSGKRANDPHGQLSFLMARADLIAATGRKRKVSEKTRSDFAATLHRSIDELKRLRAPIRNIGEFGRSHVVALIRHWLEQRQVAATIQTKASVLRRFLTLTGKAAAMPTGPAWTAILAEKGIVSGTLRRSRIPATPNAWEPLGVDAIALIQRIAQQEPVIGAEMEMQLAFGLRVKESIQIHPVLADAGNRLLVAEGTKGGRIRWVEFDPEPAVAAWQREVLERAKQLAERHPKKCLSLPGRSLAQMRGYYYYVLHKHGVTHKELGVVSHGLRHQFANRRHLAVSGLPAPVLRAAPVQAYQAQTAEVAAARSDVTAQLGHWREDLPASYNATVPWLARQARRQVAAIQADLAQHPGLADALQAAGVRAAWFVGRVAYGLELSTQHPLEIIVLLASESKTTAIDLQTRLEALLGRALMVTSTTDPSRRPADGVPWELPACEPGGRIPGAACKADAQSPAGVADRMTAVTS